MSDVNRYTRAAPAPRGDDRLDRLSNYILHGVPRDFVIELAHKLAIPVEERAIPLPDLYRADELFFTGITTEIRPAVEVDGRPVGAGKPGPVARRLFKAFLEEVSA